MTTLSKAGRYELLEELGRGAMGVVYKAHDPVIGRSVAVKIMRLSAEGTGMTREELSTRFQTEARAAGQLTHPNIVVVYDAGEEDGLFYITMEYVEGRSLQALMDAQQSFPLPRTLRLMEQACAALEFAHQRKVVHRDIKPANLMLTADETVKVTDFGTAKILQFGTAQTAHIIGTPSYMSPEQVKGKMVDGRSDIFSLGVILYELVTGEKPFPGQNVTTVIYKIVNEDPIPPRELDSTIHSGLNHVITRALAKQPEARHQSCREFMEALRNYRELGPSPEATILLPSSEVQASASGAARTSAQSLLPVRPDQELQTAGVGTETKIQRKQANLWLALFLLAVIVGATFSLWPYMREVWQTGRATLATRATRAAAEPQPAGSPAQVPSHVSPAPASTGPSTAQPVQPAPSEARPDAEKPAKTNSEPAAAGKQPASHTVAEPLPPSSSRPVRRDAAVAEIQARIERGLAQLGLAEKVHVQAGRGAFTLSGRLTPIEHRRLLRSLRNAPAWVHLVDHIEDTSPGPDESPIGTSEENEERPRPGPGRGEVEVLTDVLGASAVLHGARGRVISDCRTPCRFEDLWPGRYALEVTLAGYRPEQRILQVRAGSIVDARIQLQPISSGLFVTSRPEKADVFINGERHPQPTPTTILLGPGTYTIMVRSPGFEPYIGQVQLKGDELTRLDIELAPSRNVQK